MEQLLRLIVASDSLHAKWLNTLSYLENCGARKIARFEHPTLVRKELLKHAAEEFRHAHLLKSQIERLNIEPPPDYQLSSLIGGFATLRYLDRLELALYQQVKKIPSIYLLMTYAIEERALLFYSLYEKILREMGSPIRVKSIYLEEIEHLAEMRAELEKVPNGTDLMSQAIQIEQINYNMWINLIKNEINV